MMPPNRKPASPEENMEQMLQTARGGSKEAVGQLLEGCRQYLLLIANRKLDPQLRGKVGPSDIVQETFLDAQRDFDRFYGRSEGELLAWLRRILLNTLANAARTYRGAQKRQIDREVPLDRASPQDLDTPSSVAMIGERDDALRRALGRLPEPGRSVIQWRNYERCSFEEIGQRLGRSAEAVRKVWTRALEQLEQFLERPEEAP